jgi:hypothetical protein
MKAVRVTARLEVNRVSLDQMVSYSLASGIRRWKKQA